MKVRRKGLFRYSKHTTYFIIIFVISVLVGVGYALLTSTLNINGDSAITRNMWDVHFQNLQIKSGSKSDANVEIVNNSTTVNFDINLEEQGEYLDFTVDVVNNGTIDAMLSEVVNTGISEGSKSYLEYSVTYADGIDITEKDLLAAGESETIHVYAKYKDNIDESLLPENDVVQEVFLSITYVQADETAKPVRLLPKGYQKVEHIESSGTQYINLGLNTNQVDRIVASFIVNRFTGNTQHILGARTNMSNYKLFLQFASANSYQSLSMYRNSSYDGPSNVTLFPMNQMINIDISLHNGKQKAIINDSVIYDKQNNITIESADLYLLAWNANGAITPDCYLKLYDCKLYSYDKYILVRNFIPCYRKSDNKPGLYDLVNDVFYTNSGTGEFTVGPDIN